MDPVLIGFITYLVVILAVGFITVRLTKTLADFILAGRKLGPWVVAFSERASGESAWLLIGLPGLALATGYNAIWPAIGCCSGILFSWLVIAKRLRLDTEKYNALTLPAFFEARFEDNTRSLRITATIIIVFFFTLYVAAQFLAAGKVLNATFGMSVFNGMILGAVIILFYTIMGGFFAVAWTDLFQGIIMVFTLVLLPIAGIIELGGIQNMDAGIARFNASLLSVCGDNTGWAAISSIIGGLAIGLGYMGQPHLIIRFMAIKNPEDLKKGTVIAIFWALLAFFGAVFVGITGLSMFGGEFFADAEHVMPYMATALMPAWLAGIMISGAIAAMMSTADSQLLVSTAALSEDIYHQMMNKKADQKTLVKISRFSAVIIGVIAFLLALSAEQLVYWLVLYAWAGLGASFGPPLLLTLWWKKVTRQGVLAGMITGTVTVLIWYNVPALKNFLYELIPGFILSFIAVYVVSLVTYREE
ncbi:MAG: sodium/proline symporter [FCB group bacterium]|nr:sodium/proline symporter [FCB group bacterium]